MKLTFFLFLSCFLCASYQSDAQNLMDNNGNAYASLSNVQTIQTQGLSTIAGGNFNMAPPANQMQFQQRNANPQAPVQSSNDNNPVPQNADNNTDQNQMLSNIQNSTKSEETSSGSSSGQGSFSLPQLKLRTGGSGSVSSGSAHSTSHSLERTLHHFLREEAYLLNKHKPKHKKPHFDVASCWK